ncbi:amino acid ABC transporter permease [Pelagibacterium luteolum]|uniref:General L-amino acid transport system permease protein n=1 Tax=Pelagibacterium luteolum TaxID=440168 RepID=A0A1G7WBM9_9HYPH|nr:amino acid ABC transporter permease [Pelagibacterium luteolum]SDG69362.1 general L-amino acid transport system permease protein [Pelagibacterium luteolum]
MSHSQPSYVRTQMAEPLPPPGNTTGVVAWMRANLFSSIGNTILTFLGIALIIWTVIPAYGFLIGNAVFTDPEGLRGEACRFEGVGACWIFIQARFNFFIYGFYPSDEIWRINLMFIIGIILLIPLLVPKVPFTRVAAILFFGVYPFVAYFLMYGGVFGLDVVPTRNWGGLTLTLIISLIGIIASLPLGILLALGRQSKLPIIKGFCVAFIELWRAVPLITVLFMASVMFPLFMPQGTNPDVLLRAIIGIVLFESAYMAEVVRGGLQAIPSGQREAASALGLSKLKTTALIVMPQALKHVIPGIVNTFIALFKDTTLVSIIGIFELLNAVRAAGSDIAWQFPTDAVTGYVFAGFVFWIFCFGMSRYSIYMEDRLHTGHRR